MHLPGYLFFVCRCDNRLGMLSEVSKVKTEDLQMETVSPPLLTLQTW